MKLLLDENVPISLVNTLKRAGNDVEHVGQKCRGFTDVQVLEYAFNNKRTIISFDSDFCTFKKREHYGIIKVNGKLTNPGDAILELIGKINKKEVENMYYQIDLNGAFSERKVYGKHRLKPFKQFCRQPIELDCLKNYSR